MGEVCKQLSCQGLVVQELGDALGTGNTTQSEVGTAPVLCRGSEVADTWDIDWVGTGSKASGLWLSAPHWSIAPQDCRAAGSARLGAGFQPHLPRRAGTLRH